MCSLCHTRRADALNRPCDHCFLCFECCEAFRALSGDICNGCREPSTIERVRFLNDQTNDRAMLAAAAAIDDALESPQPPRTLDGLTQAIARVHLAREMSQCAPSRRSARAAAVGASTPSPSRAAARRSASSARRSRSTRAGRTAPTAPARRAAAHRDDQDVRHLPRRRERGPALLRRPLRPHGLHDVLGRIRAVRARQRRRRGLCARAALSDAPLEHMRRGPRALAPSQARRQAHARARRRAVRRRRAARREPIGPAAEPAAARRVGRRRARRRREPCASPSRRRAPPPSAAASGVGEPPRVARSLAGRVLTGSSAS